MSSAAQDQAPEVRTTAGIVRGRWRDVDPGASRGARFAQSAAFLGIPFAEAPTGALAFAAPVPKAAWSGVLDATAYGATAQRGDPGQTFIPEPSIPGGSTLNVNVFTPSPEVPEGGGLPVLVWIHGGGYVAGSPASPWYDGAAFNRDGVVTVTVSYRLGFVGFGWVQDAPANRGVLDWLLALEWVQANIRAFGGDPARVTIAGQSAGGGAVLTLLGMERAQHLFRSVYAMSGAVTDLEPARAEAYGRRLAETAGIEPWAAAWSAVDEARLLELQKQTADLGPSRLLGEGLALGPIVDGELITQPTTESFRRGVGFGKPLVMGATDGELAMLTMRNPSLDDLVPAAVVDAFGIPAERAVEYLAHNPDAVRAGGRALAGRAITDVVFRAPMLRLARHRGTAPTWVYRFAWPSPTVGFAGHCLDVPFFFDCLDEEHVPAKAGPDAPRPLAEALHAAAVAFVADGAPGWQQFVDGQVVRVYDAVVEDVPDGLASVRPLV